MKLAQVDLMDQLPIGGLVASQLMVGKDGCESLTFCPDTRCVTVMWARRAPFLVPLERCTAIHPANELPAGPSGP